MHLIELKRKKNNNNKNRSFKQVNKKIQQKFKLLIQFKRIV